MRHQALSDKRSPVKRERRAHPPGPSLYFRTVRACRQAGENPSVSIDGSFAFVCFFTVSIAVAADVLMWRQYVSDSDFVARTIRIR